MEATLCALPEATPLKACLHCASPVSARSRSQFCCQGCEAVHGVLQQTGLNRYYSILNRTGDRALPVGSLPQTQSSYAWLDQPEIRKEYETSAGMRFYLEGVHCTACVWLVEKLPTLVPGVESARLDLGTAVVTVKLLQQNPSKYSEAALGLLRIGYRPHPVRHSENEEMSQAEDRKLLIQLGIAGAAAGNIMLLAVSLYAGADGAFAEQFKWLSFILSVPVMAYSALPFYQSTWNALKSRQLSIDIPVALGLQISFWVSVANLIRGNELIYFDSVTALVFLLLSSRYLLRRVQRTSLNAQNLAHFLMPATARKRLETDLFAEVTLNEVVMGDILEILPGDLIPADGEIIEGKSSINTSLLTGEARPEAVECGAQVFGGTQNGEGRLLLRVAGTGASSRVGKILESMESTIRSKAPIVAFSDRVSRAFIGVTLTLLPLIFIGGLAAGWQEALDRALAVALVTCPCAFALATPLSFAASLGKAAKAGVLVKGAEILERLSRVQNLYFDKTGTLTEGRYQVLEWRTQTPLNWDPAPLIVALEANSRHPIARALRSHFANPDQILPTLANHREIPGRGVEAQWNGRIYALGPVENTQITTAPQVTELALTQVGLYEDGKLMGFARLGDPIRPESAQVISEIKRLGVSPGILSGDSKLAVDRVAKAVSLPSDRVIDSATPELKKAEIEKQAESLMVGDGANDAIALAAASVGIAVQGGLEASVRASDIYLSRPGLKQIPLLIELGRETLKVVRRNFAVSLGYNAVAATAAAFGKIDPLFAAILMPLSATAVFVSANAGTRRMRAVLKEMAK